MSSAQAGIVIGQKGSTIQQIRALSGARVNIDSHDEAQAKADPTKRDMCGFCFFVWFGVVGLVVLGKGFGGMYPVVMERL